MNAKKKLVFRQEKCKNSACGYGTRTNNHYLEIPIYMEDVCSAAEFGYTDTLLELRECGADWEARDAHGMTPPMPAILRGLEYECEETIVSHEHHISD